MPRIEEPAANAIGGQDRMAATERQNCSKGKGKVISGGRDSSSGGAGDIVRSKTGAEVRLRGPITDAWSHGDKWKSNGFSCAYCPVRRESGGVTRLRNHLAGIAGDVVSCQNVPKFVRNIMLGESARGKKHRLDAKEHRLYVEKAIMEEAYEDARRSNIPRDEDGQLEWALRESLRDTGRSGVSYSTLVGASSSRLPVRGERCNSNTPESGSGNQTTISRFFRSPSVSQAPFDLDLARSKASLQPRVDIMIQGDSKMRLGKIWSKWFQANDIPGRKADCPYFASAIKLTQQLGEGVAVPLGREIDGPLLDMNYEDLLAQMEEYKQNWVRYGVTVMCDSWTGPYKMCIINFMVFCNGRMFFLSSVDATGHSQNTAFIYGHIRKVVEDDIGARNVVQIVTDNGSNYKAACKQLVVEHQHITWQPCAAHTINLMLKEISSFAEVDEVVRSAQRMCKFFHSHNRLHATMREKIGGELTRWNATRFGTVFLFLQSFWDRKGKFQAWMVSNDWANSEWKDEADYDFTYDCLTSRLWWEDVELVLKAVTPLYCVLRFADQQKNGTISGFIPRMLQAQREIFAKLKHDKKATTDLLDRINEVINRRTRYLLNETLMLAAAALDPEALYNSNVAQNQSAVLAISLALKKLANSAEEASKAIDQFTNIFSQKKMLFGSLEARSSARRGQISPADWWSSYGGQCKDLQKLAMRIVSQCNSSSGCERNWSTFALVHTKLRNKLSYDKLMKLVYVHYNLKLYIQQFEADFQSLKEKETDPYSLMMDATFFDEANPIMDWLCNSRSESTPVLDEFDFEADDWTMPGGFLIDELQMDMTEVAAFKRKLCFSRNGGKKKGKMQLEEDEPEDLFEDNSDSDSPHGSPVYAESQDSSSASSDSEGDDDVEGDKGDGGTACVTKGDGEGATGNRVRGSSSVRIRKPVQIRPRSTRKKKPTLKIVKDL